MVERPLPAAGRGRSLQRATRCARGLGESARQHHGIDDLDNTVGLHHVADRDFGGITLGIDDPELSILFLDCQCAALHRFQRFSAAGIDLLAQVLGGEATCTLISVCLFSGFSSVATVLSGSLANASLVGAKTVNGPGPSRVCTRPAAFTAATKVV